MTRFEFRLARLAKVRAVQEEEARQVWRAAENTARAAEGRLDRIRSELGDADELLRRAQGDRRLAPREVLAIQDSIDRLRVHLDRARREVNERRADAEQAREPWQALRSELEGLERLEAKARATHRRQLEREETRQIDQIASERASRSSASALPGGDSDTNPDPRRDAAEARCTST